MLFFPWHLQMKSVCFSGLYISVKPKLLESLDIREQNSVDYIMQAIRIGHVIVPFGLL